MKIFCTLIASSMGIACLLQGQTVGTIDGRVTDQSGAAIVGAPVTVTNAGTSQVRSVVTNATGLYSVPALQAGTYNVKVEAPGFSTMERTNVTLLAESDLTLDFPLTVGLSTTQVTIQAQEEPLVETTQSAPSSTLQVSEVENLPVLNREFTGLVILMPGARPAPITNGTKTDQVNGISIGGGRGQNLNTLVDGADNRDDVVGGPLQNYTLEGIEEFRLIIHQYGAQYGRSDGGELVIVSKSGTNAVHGTAFAYGRNAAMTAIDHFTQVDHLPKNQYDREQYGGSVGGPVIKDKWFWFGAYERIQQDQTLTPTTAALANIGYLVQFGAKPANALFEPYTDNMITGKTDYQINANHSFMVRWGQQFNSSPNDTLTTSHPDLSYPAQDIQKFWSILARETWIVSPSSLNQFTFQRNHANVAQSLAGDSTSNPEAVYSPVTATLIFPDLSIGRPANDDHYFFEDKYQFRDDFSFQKGAHAWKIGADFSLFPDLGIITDLPAGCGDITFFADPSVIVNNTNGLYPEGFLTPGAVASINQGTCSAHGQDANTSLRDPKQVGLYVQDDWKVTRKLTLNLGLRYDVDINSLDQTIDGDNRVYQVLKQIGSGFGGKTPGTNMHAFGPRVGFAWDMTGNSRNVLRGGYGLFWDEGLQGNLYTSIELTNPNLFVLNSYVNTSVGTGQLANYIFGVSPLPPGPPAVSTQLPAGNNTSGAFIGPGFSLPYSQQFHLGYTRQLTGNSTLSVDASHLVNLNEYRVQNINPLEGAWDPNDCKVAVQPVADTEYLYTPCPAASQIVPYGQRRFGPALAAIGEPNLLGGIEMMTSSNRSHYYEYVFDYQRRAGRLTMNASYTLAWADGYGGSIGACTICAVSTPIAVNQDKLFGPGEWGPSSTDQRHRIVISGVVNMKWGLQAGPVFQIGSPQPYNLTAGTDLNGDGTNNDHYINPATGVPVSYNSARGIWDYDLDLRITRYFNLWSDKRRVGLFAELYNLTNKANFGNVFGGNASAPATFMQPTGYLAGLPTSRQLQLGARFTF